MTKQTGPRETARRPRSTGVKVADTQVSGDSLLLDLQLTQLNTDPAQYKPNAPTFLLEGVFVRVQIPMTEVIASAPGHLVLTPKGCAIISSQISDGYQAVLTSAYTRNRQ